MHPSITHEIGRLQIDDMVSHAHHARLARRARQRRSKPRKRSQSVTAALNARSSTSAMLT